MMKKFLIFLAVLLFVAAGPAFALTTPQTKYFSGIPSMSGSLAFDQFDTHGGIWVLDSVKVTLNLQTSGGELRLDNDSDNPASGNFEFGAKGSISSSDVPLLNSSYIAIPGTVNAYHSGSFNLAANVGDIGGDYDSSPPDGMLYTGGIETDSKFGFVGSGLWASYQGTGTYDIDYEVLQWLNYGSIGGIEYAVTPVTANGNVEVIYEYHVVPEPMTIGLLAMGGMALIRRKTAK
ncbi:MAG: PEP-CTERM sorting domain-containing protein [Phycisphaerae bacterium]|nr:PEP-CTERM sorting domain-containing protein [Phycisphaerae bacterium]